MDVDPGGIKEEDSYSDVVEDIVVKVEPVSYEEMQEGTGPTHAGASYTCEFCCKIFFVKGNFVSSSATREARFSDVTSLH